MKVDKTMAGNSTPEPSPATLAEIRAWQKRWNVEGAEAANPRAVLAEAHAHIDTLLSMLESGRDGVVDECARIAESYKPGFESRYPDIQERIAEANQRCDRIAASIRALKSGAALSPAAVVTEEQIAAVLYETECDPPVFGLTRDQSAKLAKAIYALLHSAPNAQT